MKTKIKKFFKSAVLMLGVMVFTFGISGCSFLGGDKVEVEERASGDFVARFYKEKDREHCEIIATTEQGNNKRFLVVPEYLDGVRVSHFGEDHIGTIFGLPLERPHIVSDVLEKIYFEVPVYSTTLFFVEDTPNLKKVIYPAVEPYTDEFSTKNVYYPRVECERVKDEGIFCDPKSPANVTFNYNYEDAPKGGYYWVDDCDYGGKIEFVPKAPEREGYGFVGWYKEAECVNEWDFDVDTLPEAIAEQGEQNSDSETQVIKRPIYQETVLYAKWIKN